MAWPRPSLTSGNDYDPPRRGVAERRGTAVGGAGRVGSGGRLGHHAAAAARGRRGAGDAGGRPADPALSAGGPGAGAVARPVGGTGKGHCRRGGPHAGRRADRQWPAGAAADPGRLAGRLAGATPRRRASHTAQSALAAVYAGRAGVAARRAVGRVGAGRVDQVAPVGAGGLAGRRSGGRHRAAEGLSGHPLAAAGPAAGGRAVAGAHRHLAVRAAR